MSQTLKEFIMEGKRMNEAESLELITSMINDSRARMTKNLGTPFLIWGYTTAVVSLCQVFWVANTEDVLGSPCYWLWFAIPVVGYLLMCLLCKRDTGAANYIDRCVSAVWRSIGVAAFITPFICMFGTSIFPVIILLMGIGTVITAAVIKDKMIGGIGYAAIFSSLLFVVSPYVAHLVAGGQYAWRERYIIECIIFAVIMFLLLVVSGHILNYKKKCLKN